MCPLLLPFKRSLDYILDYAVKRPEIDLVSKFCHHLSKIKLGVVMVFYYTYDCFWNIYCGCAVSFKSERNGKKVYGYGSLAWTKARSLIVCHMYWLVVFRMISWTEIFHNFFLALRAPLKLRSHRKRRVFEKLSCSPKKIKENLWKRNAEKNWRLVLTYTERYL